MTPAFRVATEYVEALAKQVPITPGTPEWAAGPLATQFVLSGIAEQYAKDHEVVGEPVWQEVEGWMLCGFRVADEAEAVVGSTP